MKVLVPTPVDWRKENMKSSLPSIGPLKTDLISFSTSSSPIFEVSRIFPINPLTPSRLRNFPLGKGNVVLSPRFGRQMMSLSHTCIVFGRLEPPVSPGRFRLRYEGKKIFADR